MKEGELSVSQRELHRMHVVRLTIEAARKGVIRPWTMGLGVLQAPATNSV